MRTRKAFFSSTALLLPTANILAQGFPGLPGDIGGGTNVSDLPAPIDGQIWLGIVGGLAIGIYFLLRGRRDTVIESKSGFSCLKCYAICSEQSCVSQTETVFKEAPDPHYSWDETHKCTNCGTLYFLHNPT
jgi:hypothetical protein